MEQAIFAEPDRLFAALWNIANGTGFLRLDPLVEFVDQAVVNKQLIGLHVRLRFPLGECRLRYLKQVFLATPVPSIAALPVLPAGSTAIQLVLLVCPFADYREVIPELFTILDASCDGLTIGLKIRILSTGAIPRGAGHITIDLRPWMTGAPPNVRAGLRHPYSKYK